MNSAELVAICTRSVPPEKFQFSMFVGVPTKVDDSFFFLVAELIQSRGTLGSQSCELGGAAEHEPCMGFAARNFVM